MQLLGYLYGMPGVGHVVAACYALAGDEDKAGEALNAANRTTAVMVGGGLGALAGPAGMAAGSYAAGSLYDCGHSFYTGKNQGLVSKVDNVVKCCKNNDLSGGLVSAFDASVYIGGDILTGWTGSVGSGEIAKNEATNAIKRNISISVQTMQLLRDTQSLLSNDINRSADNASCSSKKSSASKKSSKNNSYKSHDSSKSHKTHQLNHQNDMLGGSGSEPPKDNKRDDEKVHEVEQNVPVSFFSQFYEVFLVEELEHICINGVNLFEDIKNDKGRRDSLKTLIKKMIKNNCLKWALELVLTVMEETMHPTDVNFVNFLNLCELVTSYLIERLASRHNEMQRSRERPNDRRDPFKTRKEYYLERIPPEIICPSVLEVISQEILRIASPYNLITILNHLRLEIRKLNNMSPGFVNEMSATSHYFKHRIVPNTKIVLSVSEYTDLIRSLMESVKNLEEYDDLISRNERTEQQQNLQPRVRLCFDRVYARFGGRRARLVLKKQNGKVVISTCHILEIAIPDEEDGYEEIDRDLKGFPK